MWMCPKRKKFKWYLEVSGHQGKSELYNVLYMCHSYSQICSHQHPVEKRPPFLSFTLFVKHRPLGCFFVFCIGSAGLCKHVHDNFVKVITVILNPDRRSESLWTGPTGDCLQGVLCYQQKVNAGPPYLGPFRAAIIECTCNTSLWTDGRVRLEHCTTIKKLINNYINTDIQL